MSYFDDLEIGRSVELGRHRFEAEDIKRFAAQYDPQLFHLDEEAAAASLLGGLCASGWHTAAVAMRLGVDHRMAEANERRMKGMSEPKLGPSPGFKNLRWLKPVYASQTIRFTQTVTAKRKSASRPGWGLVEATTTGFNEKDEPVFSYEGTVFVGTQ